MSDEEFDETDYEFEREYSEWEVERVVAKRKNKTTKEIEYKVVWAGYIVGEDPDATSWELKWWLEEEGYEDLLIGFENDVKAFAQEKQRRAEEAAKKVKEEEEKEKAWLRLPYEARKAQLEAKQPKTAKPPEQYVTVGDVRYVTDTKEGQRARMKALADADYQREKAKEEVVEENYVLGNREDEEEEEKRLKKLAEDDEKRRQRAQKKVLQRKQHREKLMKQALSTNCGTACPHCPMTSCLITNSLCCCHCVQTFLEKDKDDDLRISADCQLEILCEGCVVNVAENKKPVQLKNTKALDPKQRAILSVNFYLRQCFPFELTHVVLAFTLRRPPVNFFRYFDRPGLSADPKIAIREHLARASDNYPTDASRARAQERSRICQHQGCTGIVTKQGGFNTTANAEGKAPCCACSDARPSKGVDILYIDGVGDVRLKVNFYAHYCKHCVAYWKARPGEDPHSLQQ